MEYISLPDGVVVTDRNHINEFIANADTNIYRAISSTLANNKARYDIPPMKIVCDNEECKNEFEQNLEFDAVNFFGLNS